MDPAKYMILVKGADKTEQIASIRSAGGGCEIVYNASPRVYTYGPGSVRVLPLRGEIDPGTVAVTIDGEPAGGIEKLLDFGDCYRVARKGGASSVYLRDRVEVSRNVLADKTVYDLFSYFKETAGSVSLKTGDGFNVLGRQYDKVGSVSDGSVLACYLDPGRPPRRVESGDPPVYPFGLNRSQMEAVENAFSSEVSIIQGPPGTGKTQTILNIIANAVLRGKTVAVASSNNSATRNVEEKLARCGLRFICAFLGSRENKTAFLESQSGRYPDDLRSWELDPGSEDKLRLETVGLSRELREMFRKKNRIAELNRELSELETERRAFEEYYAAARKIPASGVDGFSSGKILRLIVELEELGSRGGVGFWKRLSLALRFGRRVLGLLSQPLELVLPSLRERFYAARGTELSAEKSASEDELRRYSFDEKMRELESKSLVLFKATLARRYKSASGVRRVFGAADLQHRSAEFNGEYPVILSTTYSIKNTLNSSYIYDYLIIDESSQVDLCTGVLAFSAAKNVIIVGDLKQLPNVIGDAKRAAEQVLRRRSVAPAYRFTEQSLLSSAVARWPDAPSVLLREHYRCHPKIIGFCNKMFYDNRLIVMTEDHGESGVISMYRTVSGSHARGHVNRRQIDIIEREILPRLEREGYSDIGIITPYRDQVDALREELGDKYEIDTVHKFQGREKEAIILASVDNAIGDFVDDPNLLNVAVSRAVKAFAVVISGDPRNDKTNYGELARYIAYNNCEDTVSPVYSVFDLLYKGYFRERRAFLAKHRRVSEYDSENLFYGVLTDILAEEFSGVAVAVHVALSTIVRDYSPLTDVESGFARNPMAHVDFLLFRDMDKSPVLAVEVDGAAFHRKRSAQAARDAVKDGIFAKIGLPLLRVRTDGSGEADLVRAALKAAV